MAGLDPDDPAYFVKKAFRAIEENRQRLAAEQAAALLRAEESAIAASAGYARWSSRRRTARPVWQPAPTGGDQADRHELRERGIKFSNRTLNSAIKLAWS